MVDFIKRFKHLEHYVLWTFMFLFVFDYHFWEGNWIEAISNTSIEITLYLFIFYFNYKVAIPTFLEKKGTIVYLFFLFAFLMLYVLIIKISRIEKYLYEGNFWRNIMSMTINFGLFWLISTLYWHYQKTEEERRKQLKMRAEKLETEMKFLKNQISPHFIFNTLNNIYSLVQQNHKNAAPMLAKLSGILRYLLYDSSKDKVFLDKELNTIEEYIDLQLLRKPKSENVDFYKELNGKHLNITPLVLLNFVENCFKHSNLGDSEDGWIKITCIVKDGNHLYFTTENSKKITLKIQNKESMGNQNIQRQLELNYPDSHELTFKNKDDIFSCHLILKLD